MGSIKIHSDVWQGEEMVFGTASARELLSWIGGLEHAVGHKVQ